MNKLKKFGAIILTLALMLTAMPLSAFAANPVTTKDVSLTIYKFKDPGGTLQDGDGTPQSTSGLTPIKDVVFTIQKVTYNGTGNVDAPANYTATADAAVTGTTNDAGKIVFSTVDGDRVGSTAVLPGQGTYLVTETSGPDAAATQFLVSLPMLNPDTSVGAEEWLYDVYVYPKNEMEIGIEKEYVVPVDNNGVNGTDDNILKWNIDVTIPTGIVSEDGSSYAQNFVLTDTITPSDIEFVIGSLVGTVTDKDGASVPLVKADDDNDNDYTYELLGNVLTITLTDDGIEKLADAYTNGTNSEIPTLTFTYETTVSMTNTDNLGDVNNEVVLDYTSASGYVYDPIDADDDAVLYGIEILKTDVGGNPLGDAKFQIYTDESTATAAVSQGGTTTTALKDSDGVVLELTTDGTTGKATFYGLEPGVYYLVESAAPTGYNLLTAPIKVVVDDTNATIVTADSDYTANVTVTNSSTFTLPQTGGTGTILFTVVGLLLIGGAGVFLIMAKRKRNQNA